MTLWMMVTIVSVVSIVGGLYIEYQKINAKRLEKTRASDEELDNVLKELATLKKRVQNLEAIAAHDNDDDKSPLLDRDNVINEIVRENMERVSSKAKSRL